MKDQIAAVEITDTYGIAHRHFAPKSVTMISGRNGSGKSSVIRSIAKVFEGGKTPEIIRKGAKKSIIQLILASGTTITKSTTAKSSTLEIVGPNGEPINAPQTYINQLSEALAVDPSKILRMDAATEKGRKELIGLLLTLMPIQFEPEEIAAAVEGYAGTCLDLDSLDKLKADLTEKRRRFGVQERDAYGTVNTLRKTLPEEDEKDWNAELIGLEEKAEAARTEEADKILGVRGESKAEAAGRGAEFAEREAKLRDEFQRAMAALNAERLEMFRVIDKAETEAIEEIRAGYAPVRQDFNTQIAAVKQKAIAQTKAQGTRESIEEWEKKRKVLVHEYDRLSAELSGLDALKRRKLDSLPVTGVEFSEDRVLIDGVEWQNVNTARRVEVAMQLASLRAGDLSLMLLDDAEHLDADTRRLLEHGLVQAGFQLIEARVQDDCPLRIVTVDAAAMAAESEVGTPA